MKMDISKLKELHSKIKELKDRIEETDSKKESKVLEREADLLEMEFEDVLDNILSEIPDEVTLELTVKKVVSYDTSSFKDWIVSTLLGRDNINDLDLIQELKENIDEDYYPIDDVDNFDIKVKIVDDRLK